MTRKPCNILNSRRAGSLWLWENKKEMRNEKKSQIFLQKNGNLQKNNIQLQSQLKYISEPAEKGMWWFKHLYQYIHNTRMKCLRIQMKSVKNRKETDILYATIRLAKEHYTY